MKNRGLAVMPKPSEASLLAEAKAEVEEDYMYLCRAIERLVNELAPEPQPLTRERWLVRNELRNRFFWTLNERYDDPQL